MARQPRGRDWQERAFEESELQRQGQSSGDPNALPEDLRVKTDRPRRSSWRATLIAVAIVVVALIVRVGLNSRAPSLTTSCTTPAFSLSSTSPVRGDTVRWAATGPAKTHFLITLGITRLEHVPQLGHLHAVPEPGHNAATTQQVVPTTTLPSDCKANGAFSVAVPSGTYTVTMFRLTGTGATLVGTAVATKTMKVSS
jgi:hypothetical protein